MVINQNYSISPSLIERPSVGRRTHKLITAANALQAVAVYARANTLASMQSRMQPSANVQRRAGFLGMSSLSPSDDALAVIGVRCCRLSYIHELLVVLRRLVA